MSSIDRLSSAIFVTPSNQTQGVQQTSGAGGDSDGDGDGGQKVHRSGGHRHGQGSLQNALMQALQSLGLSAPAGTTGTQSTTGTGSTPQSAGATDSDGDSDGTTSAASSTKSDIRKFMHALFQAVKGESASAGNTPTTSATGATGATDPRTNFASGLSALITQVSNGQASTDLQNAFAKVVTDLQGTAGTSTSGSSTTPNPQATLQALLTQLQQNLGYGAASSSSALGNLVSEHA